MILNEKIEIHDKLNPLIWQEDNSLLPEVRESLFNVIKEFKEYCDIPLNIVDAVIVGSNASFNYTSYSDIDLHLIVNFDLIDASKEVLLALFNAEKTSFNKAYNIKIHGIDVELYVEDINTSAVSNGIYSLYMNEWIKFPSEIDSIKEVDIEKPVNKWVSRIDKVLSTNSLNDINNAINTLYMIRKNSINVNGEFGAGNQLFKEIRNKGLLDKLKDKRIELLSKSLSLESLTEGFLFEDSRNQLISRGKSGQNYKDQSKGKNRFQRRTKSRISASVREYNSIDMNKFFKDNILDVNIVVQGETNKYEVKISFGNILDTLSREIERSNAINPRIVIRALTSCFNDGNVYIHCSCPDWRYRFDYYANINQLTSETKTDDPLNRPSKITNPNDKLGPGCKHVLLVLSNTSWIIKVASVINNYIKYIQDHYEKEYAEIIYPALYNKKYTDPVQLSLFDDDNLQSTSSDIEKSNEEGRVRGQFKKGNTQGVRFAPKNNEEDGQQELDFDEDEEV